MKPFFQLRCDQQQVITEKVLNFLHTKTSLLENLSVNTQLWYKISTVDLVRNVPELVQWFRTLNLRMKEASITIVTPATQADLHIDELPVVAKINFLILNTKNTYNRWYDIPNEIKEQYPAITNRFGSVYYKYPNIDYSKCTLLGEVELLEPVVFNSQIAHNIVMTEQAIYPRVVLSCTFFNEPVNLLG